MKIANVWRTWRKVASLRAGEGIAGESRANSLLVLSLGQEALIVPVTAS